MSDSEIRDDWAKESERYGDSTNSIMLINLRSKLKARGDALQGIREAHHSVYGHKDPLETCPNGVCRSILELLKRTSEDD